jgi:acetyl esterase/lipase
MTALTAELGRSLAPQVGLVEGANVVYSPPDTEYTHPPYIQERLAALGSEMHHFAYRRFLEESRFAGAEQLARLARLHTSEKPHHPAIAHEIYSLWRAGRFVEYQPTESHVMACYGKTALGIDVYVPPGKVPKDGWPVVMIVPGGAFFFASKSGQHGVFLARALVRGGYTVACVDYRQIQHTLPSLDANMHHAVRDVRDSLSWLDENKARLGMRAGPVALTGISSGAAVASLVAAHFQDSVHTLATLYGVFDPSCVGGVVGNVILKGLYGLSPPNIRDRYHPVRRQAPVPMFMAHGDQDDLATPAHFGAMAMARLNAGLETYPVVIQGMRHGHRGHYTDFFDQEARMLLRFLNAMEERRTNP